MEQKKHVLITGCAGFIGMHLCESLLKKGEQVVGVDNLNNYYDINLKEDRLKRLLTFKNFTFYKKDISEWNEVKEVFKKYLPVKVINLAAQAGVRYSLENPQAYIQSNIAGFMNILEGCRHYGVKGLVYASSSSVYGGNQKIPFSVFDDTTKPLSIYAASKLSNESMAYTYSHLYGLKTTGLRFFTVYGPWGRPDMAMYIFANKIINNEPIPVFNHGKMKRDFTYIDDIISGIIAAIDKNYDCDIFNLGNNCSEDLMDMIKIIENSLGISANINLKEIQPGDVERTYADIEHTYDKLGYTPKTSIEKGIPKFIAWYKSYYKIS